MYTIVLHISNSEPVKLDVEELPSSTATCVIGKNPRLRSDREVDWVDEGVTTVVIPMYRLNYIQVMPGDDETLDFPLTYRD
ncbi:MAG: hypothetical protein Phog2KO_16110 [Phototrophicaceae bacterium]